MQKKEIEADEGTVYFDMIGCYGFQKGVMELEIVSVAEDTVTVSIAGKEYVITPEKPAEISCRKLVNGICEFDKLILQCFMK